MIVEENAKEVITVKKAITFLLAISVLFVMATCTQSKNEQPQSATEKENTTVETTVQPTTAQPAANSATSASEFDFNSKTVKLNSGYEMPILGLGTWTLSNEECNVIVLTFGTLLGKVSSKSRFPVANVSCCIDECPAQIF